MTMNKTKLTTSNPLKTDEARKMDAYWRAANYLSVGQIYLMDNALLREPLKIEHVKPRLLGHWGTTPGLNFIYVHFNRLIKKHDLNVIYVTGPGHGGPGLVANTYLEGTYSEFYPNIPQNALGMKRLFKQFSFPGGIPSTWRPRRQGRFTKEASWATAWCTRTARRLTIPICWSVASWAMARRRLGRSLPVGIRTNF
jgi:xylulose-5-phosphate/fructose-6-phosphate phosphoketolase